MRKQFALLSIALAIVLGGCGNNPNQAAPVSTNQKGNQLGTNNSTINLYYYTSKEVHKGLKEAKNPKFKVGSQVIIQAEHMPGMKGATATVTGAYDTIVYSVSYTPTTGGAKVTNHKWVIQEDIQNAESKPYKPGDKVILTAEHMPGMKGATATIVSAQQTTAYMVDYTPTNGGQLVKNHQWLIGSELSPK